MGKVVFAGAASHTPGLTGWFGIVPEEVQQHVAAGYALLAEEIAAAELDALLVVANDHIANARVNCYPDFTFGLAAEHVGPDEWFRDWLQVGEYRLRGNPAVADAIFKGFAAHDIAAYATSDNLKYDDNLSVPTVMLRLEANDIPVVPIVQNCTVPPMPDQWRCHEIGTTVRRIVEEQLAPSTRIGILASGGTAHEPGGPKYLEVNEEYDRHFLDLLVHGDRDKLLEETTIEAMEAAGSGGTAELLSWIIAMGAAGDAPCEELFYAARPEWRCGVAGVRWQLTDQA